MIILLLDIWDFIASKEGHWTWCHLAHGDLEGGRNPLWLTFMYAQNQNLSFQPIQANYMGRGNVMSLPLLNYACSVFCSDQFNSETAEASWEFLINLLVRVKIICFVRDLRNKHRQIFEGRESSSQSPGSSLAEEYSRDNPQNIKSVVNQAPGATSQQNTSDHQTTESRGCLDPGKNHMFCLNIECARSKKCCDICIFRPSVTLPSWHPWHVSSTAATCLTHVSHNRSTRCICRWSSTRVRDSLGLCSSGNNYQFLPRLYHRDNNIIK